MTSPRDPWAPSLSSSWQEHFGYKTDPFRGLLKDASGATVDTREATGEYGIGFGPGDLRKARREGWTALSILDYLKGPTGSGGLGTHESSQYYADTGGQAIATPQEVINELRQDEALQNRMAEGWTKFNDMFKDYEAPTVDLSGYAQKSDLDSYASKSDVTKNTQDISRAMLEAQKVRQNNPYAVTGNSAMGIQQAQSPSQVAGQISAGLAGFSRNQKKFKNKTLNV